MKKSNNDSNQIKKYICYALAGLAILIGIIRMVYGLIFANDPNPWYDYLIELLFLSFIGAMILRLAKTFK